MRILIIALVFISSVAKGQIQDFQLKGPEKTHPVDSIWVMGVDTNDASTKKNLGKWWLFNNLLSMYDTDWLEVGTDEIPTNSDTAYREGVTMIGAYSDTINTWSGALNLVGRWDTRFPNGNSRNIAIGPHSGGTTLGSSNIAIGDSALYSGGSGSIQSIAIGTAALRGATPSRYNTAIGYQSLYSGSGTIAGGYSVGVGYQSGRLSTESAAQNTIIGARAGYTNSTGDRNIFLGYQAGYSETGSDKLYIESSNSTSPLILGDFAADSLLINGKLGFTTTAGTATTITGRLGTQFTNVGTGWGIDLTSGNLVVDSSQVATQYDLTTISGGSTDLTIGGSGPTYTIESSTGTDVTIAANPGISLGESPANTLVISNDGVVEGVNASDATHHYFDLLDFSASSLGTLTLTEGTNITLTTSGTSANGIVTIASTEVDGSVTNEAWTIDGDDADTEVISNQTYKFEGAGIITTDVDAVNNKLIITGTEVDGSTTNELIEIEENNVSEGTGMLRLDFLNPFDVAVVGAEADISLDLDEVPTDADGGGAPEGDEYVVGSDGAATNEKWAITNFDLSSTNEAWTIDGDAGDTEVISNQTVLFDGTGIVSTTYTASSNTMTIAATEVDGSTTNEAWTVDGDDATTPVVVSNQTLAFRGNRGIDTDLIDGVTDSISLIVDGSEWDAVTIYETDDYMQMYDSGNGKLERISQANYITELESLLTVPADGNGIYDGDGTTPTDTDVSVTDSLEFNGVLKIINDANDRVGVGSQSPEAKLHVRETAATVEAMLETTSEKVELQTKSISDGVQSPFTLSVFNKDANIDLSGDYYQMANITFSKASETTAGGSINFNIGYDSTHVDGVLTLKSRETGATDGLVNVVGGLRYKWTSSASATYTLNTGDFGLTMTTTGAKTATLPDAVTGIIGQYFSIFNNAASGDITIAITGGSGDTIYGDTVLAINESAYVTCVAANKWIINN